MIRFCVIGSNFIAERFLEAARHCLGFTLAGYYSRDKQRAQEYARKYNAALSFDNLEALAACKEIDAVYVASPNSLHHKQVLLLLGAGKHVLCEKPIASNYRELQTMLESAEKNRVVLLEAMRPLFNPAVALIRDSLKKLGTIRRATLNYCQYSSRYDKFKAGIIENAFDPSFSNGALMDIGVYCVHVMLYLFGFPQRIQAAGIQLKGSIDGEGTILASYDSMLVELIYSKITDSQNPSEIQGENGCLHIDMLSNPGKIEIIYKDGTHEVLQDRIQPLDMVYEINKFIHLIGAPKQAKDYHRYSETAISLMDEVRRELNIVFPADKINTMDKGIVAHDCV